MVAPSTNHSSPAAGAPAAPAACGPRLRRAGPAAAAARAGGWRRASSAPIRGEYYQQSTNHSSPAAAGASAAAREVAGAAAARAPGTHAQTRSRCNRKYFTVSEIINLQIFSEIEINFVDQLGGSSCQ